MELGKMIRQYRKEKDLSQPKLSEGICARPYLSRIENGRQVPGPDVLAALADRLGVPLSGFADVYLKEVAVTTGDYIRLSKKLTSRGHYEEAKYILDILNRRLQETDLEYEDTYRLQRDYRDALGYWHNRQGNYEEALENYVEYLNLCQRRPSNKYNLARAHFVVGNNSIYVDGYKKAEDSLFLAFSHVISLDPKESPVASDIVQNLHERVVQALLHVLIHLRKYAAARNIYRMARLRWDELGIVASPNESILLNAGFAHLGSGDYSNARHFFERIQSRNPDPPFDRLCLNNLGLIYRAEGKPQRAVGFLKEAWELFEDQGGWDGRAVANEIARCYLQLGQHERTNKWLRRADDICTSHPFDENPDSVAQTLVAKARLAHQSGDTDGLSYLKNAEALDLSEEGRWGVSFEKVKYLIEEGKPEEEILEEIEQLRRRLPGIFIL